MRHRKMRRAVKFALFAPLALIVFGLVCLVVMSLWNWLVPAVVGWKAITFWQAAGLLLLARILFGGRHGGARWSSHWRHRMMERWERMTPEERERFRETMRARCGHAFDSPAETPAETPTA
jgi:hypothetical protein